MNTQTSFSQIFLYTGDQNKISIKSDYYTTGKLYRKLSAYLKLGDELHYMFSTCQYKTIKKFKESILSNYELNENGKLVIIKE